MTMVVNPIHVIELPNRAELPLAAPCLPQSAEDDPRTPYVAAGPGPTRESEQLALSMWINTHQALFLTVGAASAALRAALDLVRAEDYAAAAHWLGVARDLRLSSAAYTALPAMTREVYESFIRPSMLEVRPGFSGVSSRESIVFAALVVEWSEPSLLERAAAQPGRSGVQTALDELHGADETWWRGHAGAMRTLVNVPVSLAMAEYKRRVDEQHTRMKYGDFLKTNLQCPDALVDYDRYFGVERRELSPARYLETFERALDLSGPYVSSDEATLRYRELATRHVRAMCAGAAA